MMTVRELRSWYGTVLAENPFSLMAMHEISDPGMVRRQLEQELTQSLRSHESLEQLTGRIRRVSGVNETRARTIAQTERTHAQSAGRLRRMLEPYFQAYDRAVRNHKKRPRRPKHQWVEPMVAKQPRHDHIGLSGKIVYVGEEFGFGLRIPGDFAAPIEQTANCHCYTRLIKEAD